MTSRIRPCGLDAVLVDCADLDDALALAARLRGHGPPVAEVVPAARTVLARCDDPAELDALRAAVIAAVNRPSSVVEPAPAGRTVTLDVYYDGPDLDDLAAHLELTPADLVARHSWTTWRAAFGGFAPGFVYLVPADGETLFAEVPRRASPRTSVPRGSVALAAGYSAVYPDASPGGWQLVGTTDAALWRTDRTPPALIAPGDTVRFRPAAPTGEAATR